MKRAAEVLPASKVLQKAKVTSQEAKFLDAAEQIQLEPAHDRQGRLHGAPADPGYPSSQQPYGSTAGVVSHQRQLYTFYPAWLRHQFPDRTALLHRVAGPVTREVLDGFPVIEA